MTDAEYDVAGIGNAIVDVVAHAEDAFLTDNNLPKGGMTLIDDTQADRLYDRMGAAIESSGGSAANTMACLASLGGSGVFFGKVADDALGKTFQHDMRATGIGFTGEPLHDSKATARCLVLVTKDAERTMATFLGACTELGPEDINTDQVARAQVLYLEGYLWDPPRAKEAFLKGARAAHEAGRKVALSLSDQFCVDRHRDEFRDLVANHVDILFANESEIKSLYEVDSFDEAFQRVRQNVDVAALTRSAQGSVVVTPDEVHIVDAEKISRVVDTTGAGDAYAGGFLYGYTRGLDLATCARLGGMSAAEVISHFGARPETPLAQLAKEAGLI